jgi:hypothetical protein
MSDVIIMGSGPGVLRAQGWAKASGQVLVAINNAWRVRTDWDYLIYPEDFPQDRHPDSILPGQRIVSAEGFVPAQNRYGGFVYGGGTMAFTAAYWALADLAPRTIAMIGCDMVYPATGRTHFYGKGEADPLRDDITLRSLEAKSARLLVLAAEQGCAMVNLSDAGESRLVYPRVWRGDLPTETPLRFDERLVNDALRAEAEAAYSVPSGRYWEEAARFDPGIIDRIDAAWIAAAETGLPAVQRAVGATA